MNFSKRNISTLQSSRNYKISKLSSVILLLSIFSFLFISCDEPQKPQQDNIKPTKEMLTHIIKADKAKNLYNNYKKQRIDIFKDTLKKLYGNDFEDTRTIWFDLKTIKNYIAYIEQKSADNKIEPEGLQFYFSVYSDNESLGKKRNQQTFFIAPTIKKGKTHYGYTLEKHGDSERILLLKDMFTNNDPTQQNLKVDKASFFTLTSTQDGNGLLFNDGTSSPPEDNY